MPPEHGLEIRSEIRRRREVEEQRSKEAEKQRRGVKHVIPADEALCVVLSRREEAKRESGVNPGMNMFSLRDKSSSCDELAEVESNSCLPSLWHCGTACDLPVMWR